MLVSFCPNNSVKSQLLNKQDICTDESICRVDNSSSLKYFFFNRIDESGRVINQDIFREHMCWVTEATGCLLCRCKVGGCEISPKS